MSPTAATGTRDRLIDAAMNLFWEKGYANTSMSDLLGAAKANSGSFYHFFKSKEDLLVAVLDKYFVLLHPAMLAPAWEGIDDPIERIFALLARYRMLILRQIVLTGVRLGGWRWRSARSSR